jgi:hypothetical protein
MLRTWPSSIFIKGMPADYKPRPPSELPEWFRQEMFWKRVRRFLNIAALVTMGILLITVVCMFGFGLLLHSTALFPTATAIAIVLFVLWSISWVCGFIVLVRM